MKLTLMLGLRSTILKKGIINYHINKKIESKKGDVTEEIYVMHGETAAAASFSRRRVKEKDAGISKMAFFNDNSTSYCTQRRTCLLFA